MATTTTSIVNLPYWNILPMGVSNWGGDTQVYTVEPYSGGQVSMALNPAAYAQIPPITATGVYPGVNIDMNQVDSLAQAWCGAANAQANATQASMLANMINSTKEKLLSKLATEGIDSASRQKLEALLDRLDEYERQFQEAKNIQDSGERYRKMSEIEVGVRGVVADTAQLKVTTNNTEEATNSENTTNTEEATGTQETTNTQEPQGASDGATVSTNASDDGTIDFDAMADDAAARTLAQNFRDAINHTNWLGIAGTDDEKFDSVCESITAENVVAVMLAYNKFHSSEDGESFMEAFMYDADGDQKPEFGKHIANCLKEVTIALGIYDECDKDFTEIYDELGDGSIDNKIYECYDRILERICKAGGGSKYATRTNGESKLPAENESEE